ncbi:MAG: hypothetical protein IJD63_02325 [Oscillospiraceae bacterium]|nr:hypothetical protein [Oscillospiraceae bacterium]
MKKWTVLLTLLLLLSGCSAEKDFETVGDVYAPVTLTPREVMLTLPSDAAVQTLGSDAGKLYLCDGYTVTVQTLQGGNLEETIRSVTGFSSDRLTLLETQKDGFSSYSCVWSAAGEGGDQIARTVILDDGNFHYAVTAMADSNTAGQLSETWLNIFRSVSLRTD